MNPGRIEIYRDTAGLYRWRKVAQNGQTTAGPQQGYTRKGAAIEAAVKSNPTHPRERVWDLTERPALRCRSVLLDGLPSGVEGA